MAQDLIANLPGDILDPDDFVVEEITQTNASNAVIKTQLKAAFRFQKVNGKWIPQEVRLGNDQWESIEDLVKTLRKVKEDKTRELLNAVSKAIEKYCLKNGRVPDFGSYDILSDLLAPEYLDPLIRLDAWEHSLHAVLPSARSIKLVSAGADGELGTRDDIEVTATCAGK